MNFVFKKRFGQNFLINKNIISKIVDSLNAFDDIVEIGPGNGSLTKELLLRGKKITAIDIDPECIESLKSLDNISLILADILNYDLPYKTLVGNLPYNISSKILEKIVLKPVPFAVFMLQKEVAELLTCVGYSKLSVFVNARYDVCKYLNVSSESFIPRPKVNSQVVILKEHNRYSDIDLKLLKHVLHILFMQRRKKLTFIKKIDKIIYDLMQALNFNLDARIENIQKEQIYDLVLKLSENSLYNF